MRRTLTLFVLLLSFGLGATALAPPVLAAQGWEEVRDRMVQMPPGFSELNAQGTLNGKIDLRQLFEMSGQQRPKGVSDKELAELNDAGFARTVANQEAGDVLVVMGFRANSDDEAGFMVEGMLDSARRNGQFTRDTAASTEAVHVYSLSSPDANGQAAVVRKGKYAYMFLVAGQYGEAHKNLAKDLATKQLDALPAGATSVGGDESSGGAVLVALLIGLLVIGLVVFLIVRSSQKAKKAREAQQQEQQAGYSLGGEGYGAGAGAGAGVGGYGSGTGPGEGPAFAGAPPADAIGSGAVGESGAAGAAPVEPPVDPTLPGTPPADDNPPHP